MLRHCSTLAALALSVMLAAPADAGITVSK